MEAYVIFRTNLKLNRRLMPIPVTSFNPNNWPIQIEDFRLHEGTVTTMLRELVLRRCSLTGKYV